MTIDQPVNHTLYFFLHSIRIHNLINDPINAGFHSRHFLQITHDTSRVQLIANGQVSFKISVNFPAAQHDASSLPVCTSSTGFSVGSCSVQISRLSFNVKSQKICHVHESKQQQDRPVQVGGHRLVHSDPQVLVGRLQDLFLRKIKPKKKGYTHSPTFQQLSQIIAHIRQ